MGFEADTPAKIQQRADRTCMRFSDEDLVKKLLTSNQKFRLLVNSLLTRSLSDGHVSFIFPGYVLSPCQSDQY